MSKPKTITLAAGVGGSTLYECPYWDLLPLLSAEERAITRGSIERWGIKTPLTVLLLSEGHYRVIDGYHRLSLAEELNLSPDDVPINQIGDDTDYTPEEEEALARSLNEDRRQLTPEYQARRLEERRALAAALRGEGKSYRVIAEKTGVDVSTAYTDVKKAGVGAPTPEAAITGKDGKSYPAKAPPKPEQPSLLIQGKGRDQSVFDQAVERQADRTSPVQEPAHCQWYACFAPISGQSEGRSFCAEHLPRAVATMPKAPSSPLLDQVASLGAVEESVDRALAAAGPLDPKTLLPSPKPQGDRAEPDGSAPETYQQWNTPPWLLDLVREVAPIALDPCSNEWSFVQATRELTRDDDGLSTLYPWAQLVAEQKGLVYVNPPYNDPTPWVQRALAEAALGAEIVLCLPTSHSADWWRQLAKGCSGLALLSRRVDFYREGKVNGSSRHETTIFYLGNQAKRFHRVFLPQGLVMLSASGQAQPDEAPITDTRQVVLPRAKPQTEPQEPTPAPKEEPSPWLERGLADLKKATTREEVDLLAKDLLHKAATHDESKAVASLAVELRHALPHAENVRSPRPETYRARCSLCKTLKEVTPVEGKIYCAPCLAGRVRRAAEAAMKPTTKAPALPRGAARCHHKQGSQQCKNSSIAPSKFCISHLKKTEGKKKRIGQ